MQKPRFSLIALVLMLPSAYLSGCGALDALVLRPSDVIHTTPADFGYEYESLSLPGEDGNTVSIWHVPTTAEKSKGIVVIVPGNDANKGRYASGLPVFIDEGWDVVLMDYEGYGESTGTPSFEGLIRSTRTAIAYAKSKSDVVVGFGVSLGTPVLVRVAADTDLTAVMFESLLNLWEETSLFAQRNMINTPLTLGANAFAAAATGENYDVKRWIQQVSEPKLFLHSPEDSATPFEGAWDIYRIAPKPKHIFVTEGEHALQLFIDPVLYRSVVNGWLDGVLNTDPILNEKFQDLLDNEVRITLQELGLLPPG